MRRIERPPLAAANTASIHEGGGTVRAVMAQPLLCRSQADPRLGRDMGQWLRVLNVLTHKPSPNDGCQSGDGGGMHGL